MPRPTTLLIATALIVTCLVPSTYAATAAAPERADLTTTAGDVTVSGARVTGWFTVRNNGDRTAPATSAAIKVDGRRVRSVRTRAVRPGGQRMVRFRVRLGGGTHVVRVCADRRDVVTERRERNNCRTLGTVTVESTSVPANPVSYTPGSVFRIGTSPDEYWMYVPPAYDDSHRTPTRIVVFVHGCGGTGEEYATLIKNLVADLDHLVMTPGLGRDGQCWDPTADAGPLLESIADVKTRFNVDPRRVVLGGYSSGSTLAGQVAFEHADGFAGLVVVPGRPFWSDDNREELMAAADWKLNVAWRAHTGDEYYPIATLRADKRALKDSGFPVAFSEVDGGHEFTEADLDYVFGKAATWTAP
ncbi:alpha/beta fold hydrolase [Nocardioides sp.]|uniref:alpha/beta fold hydrolase n=1 Tax=Nocardioides sp. TaxID=35761 RepID=UPI001A29CF67|nr:alpha/beta fold hydrolase [Nocardioides sp.]MBJ7356924.1 alpha/beta fold hydrolase [Nocardioides sp.]